MTLHCTIMSLAAPIPRMISRSSGTLFCWENFYQDMSWMRNFIYTNQWNSFTHPSPNFAKSIFLCVWLGNYISHRTVNAITCPCPNRCTFSNFMQLSLTWAHLVKQSMFYLIYFWHDLIWYDQLDTMPSNATWTQNDIDKLETQILRKHTRYVVLTGELLVTHCDLFRKDYTLKTGVKWTPSLPPLSNILSTLDTFINTLCVDKGVKC